MTDFYSTKAIALVLAISLLTVFFLGAVSPT